MTVAHDLTHRGSALTGSNGYALEDRFEVLKEIGDGSFGSVVLARVRTAGANVARRGTVVSSRWQQALKWEELTYDSGRNQNDEKVIRVVHTMP